MVEFDSIIIKPQPMPDETDLTCCDLTTGVYAYLADC